MSQGNLRLVRPDDEENNGYFHADENTTSSLGRSLLSTRDHRSRSEASYISERANSEAREASLVVFGGIMLYSFVVCLENVIVFPSLWPNLLQYCGADYDEHQLQTYLGWTMGAVSFL
jgi:hypothetical protein